MNLSIFFWGAGGAGGAGLFRESSPTRQSYRENLAEKPRSPRVYFVCYSNGYNQCLYFYGYVGWFIYRLQSRTTLLFPFWVS